jgi:hypothetical protein
MIERLSGTSRARLEILSDQLRRPLLVLALYLASLPSQIQDLSDLRHVGDLATAVRHEPIVQCPVGDAIEIFRLDADVSQSPRQTQRFDELRHRLGRLVSRMIHRVA